MRKVAYLVAEGPGAEDLHHTAVEVVPVHVSAQIHPNNSNTHLAISILLWRRRRLPVLPIVVVIVLLWRLSVTLLRGSNFFPSAHLTSFNALQLQLTELHSPAEAVDIPAEAARRTVAVVADHRSCCGTAVPDSTTWRIWRVVVSSGAI